MKKIAVSLSVLSALLFFSCKKEKSDIMMIVASQKGTAVVVGEFPCYIVKFSENEPWRRITETIVGFDYEPGFEYVLMVKKEDRDDGLKDALGRYILRRVISKAEKDSENLPDVVIPETDCPAIP